MELLSHGKIKRVEKRYTPEMSKQSGFPTPATHYLEPSIRLEQELISNNDATFYVRIDSDELAEFTIYKNDVLIIDRSFHPKENNLAMVIKDGAFKVIRIPPKTEREEFQLWGVITYIIHSCR